MLPARISYAYTQEITKRLKHSLQPSPSFDIIICIPHIYIIILLVIWYVNSIKHFWRSSKHIHAQNKQESFMIERLLKFLSSQIKRVFDFLNWYIFRSRLPSSIVMASTDVNKSVKDLMHYHKAGYEYLDKALSIEEKSSWFNFYLKTHTVLKLIILSFIR